MIEFRGVVGPHAKTDVPEDVRERLSAGRAADPDSDVIGRVAYRDMTGALRRLMQRHGTSVFRYCREALRDRALAEDVQQQRELGTAPSTTIDRNVILYLAARSVGTGRRALEEECATIERELRLAGRHGFEFRSRWAATIDEVMHHLNELQPNIVHFSGQESNQGLHINANAGIRLQDEHCQSRHVSASALSRMIGSAAPSTRLVVLNSCFSNGVAKSLCKVTDCVVGMRSTIDDEATRSFAVGFYRALGYGRSVGNALAQAIATLAAKEFPDEQFPFCFTRDGISVDQIILSR